MAIEVDCLTENEDLNIIVTRSKFEELCMPLFKNCLSLIEKVLKDSNMSKSQVDEVILVGGSTRIPKIV